MAKFKAKPGLDAEIASRFGAPAVHRALVMLTDAAKATAPPVRVWVSERDERVRTTHRVADGQAIIDNLRFRIPAADGLGTDLARHPRDPTLPIENRINCRCDDQTLPQPFRDSIDHTEVVVTGTRAAGQVATRYPRAAESEFGTGDDTASHCFTNALREVGARLQSGHSR